MLRIFALSLAAIVAAVANASGAFALMNADEVDALLAAAPAKEAAAQPVSSDASSAEAANYGSADAAAKALEITAQDMVGKVYGVLDHCNSMQECLDGTREALRLTPSEEDDDLWLDAADGYNLSYYGRTPDVSALARFGNGADAPVTDFGYFFIFPNEKNSEQVDFTGTLLQEIHDLGIPMSVCESDGALFAAVGDYEGRQIDIRLLDGPERYILILSVEP